MAHSQASAATGMAARGSRFQGFPSFPRAPLLERLAPPAAVSRVQRRQLAFHGRAGERGWAHDVVGCCPAKTAAELAWLVAMAQRQVVPRSARSGPSSRRSASARSRQHDGARTAQPRDRLATALHAATADDGVRLASPHRRSCERGAGVDSGRSWRCAGGRSQLPPSSWCSCRAATRWSRGRASEVGASEVGRCPGASCASTDESTTKTSRPTWRLGRESVGQGPS